MNARIRAQSFRRSTLDHTLHTVDRGLGPRHKARKTQQKRGEFIVVPDHQTSASHSREEHRLVTAANVILSVYKKM